MLSVEFDDDIVGQSAESGGDADACGKDNFSAVGHVGGFDDGRMDFAQEAVAEDLRQFGEVEVKVVCFAVVQQRPQVFVGLVGSTELYCFGSCQFAVESVAGGSACEHTDLEGFALFVECYCPLCDSCWDGLWAACGGESAKAHVVAVVNVSRRFFGGNVFQWHRRIICAAKVRGIPMRRINVWRKCSALVVWIKTYLRGQRKA